MNIVILDGYTLNPGDLSWDDFRQLGNCTIYDRTPANLTLERSRNAEAIVTNKTVIDGELISRLEKLRYIGVLATGYNVVDTGAAREHNIPVTNVPGYSTDSVAQMVFAHILNLTQHVADHSRSLKDGAWSRSEDFCFWEYPLIELSGKTLGIIGTGRTGLATARIAIALGMKVIAYNPRNPADLPQGIKLTTLEALLAGSDIVSLHCPLTESTRNMINASALAAMKSSAFLINTGRGPLVDEQALADALNNGKIAGAGLDVLSSEPPSPGNPLPGAKNCYITPHIAWASEAARKRLMEIAAGNLRSFITGKPVNVVNP